MILHQDIERIYVGLSQQERDVLQHKTILVTGFAGSLGFMLVQFLSKYRLAKHVYLLDNYTFGKPDWVATVAADIHYFTVMDADVTTCDFPGDANLIFHMASLASPVYYRQYPLETMDADVMGLYRLLDFYRDKSIYNLLFYSTSEIYGDPDLTQVPTPETYWGNVNPLGPRACYDESKRYGETLCYNYHHVHGFPVSIVRPFNSYGPGLRTHDKRAPADFAHNVLNNEDIVIYSDGTATRTFCYNTDMTLATLKIILQQKFDVYNAGNDQEEMTIKELAELYQRIGQEQFGYTGQVVYRKHADQHYNTDNPQRRCPDLTKIKAQLGYTPQVAVAEGVMAYLDFLKSDERERLC